MTRGIALPKTLSHHMTIIRAHNGDSNTTLLHRRQCLWSPNDSEWVCDFHYPTVSQMIARMRDATDSGLATHSNVVYFYTNLREPTPAEKDSDTTIYETHQRWILGWLKSKSLTSYSAFNAENPRWLEQQRSWLTDNTDLMDENDLDLGKMQRAPGEPVDVFKNCRLQAVAGAAMNKDAYLFTAKGEEWRADSGLGHG